MEIFVFGAILVCVGICAMAGIWNNWLFVGETQTRNGNRITTIYSTPRPNFFRFWLRFPILFWETISPKHASRLS